MNQDMGQEARELAAALEAAEVQIEQLETALRSRIVIEQAKGILRERFGWTVEEAFEVLRYGARSSRSSIHALAEQVVESSDTPLAITVAIARSSRWRAAHYREVAEAQRERAAELAERLQALESEKHARDSQP
ncbi:MAG: ANTAR domain-containing protein [Gaiellaceae bacterium]